MNDRPAERPLRTPSRFRRRTAPCPGRAPAPEAFHQAVHRLEDSVSCKRLDPEAHAILAALQAGASLEEALDAGLRSSAMAEGLRPGCVAWAFQDWAGFGWFTQVLPEAP